LGAHRLHRYNLLWGAHPATTLEDFNLSTALRKGAFQTAFDWPFYLPLDCSGCRRYRCFCIAARRAASILDSQSAWTPGLRLEQVLSDPRSPPRASRAERLLYLDRTTVAFSSSLGQAPAPMPKARASALQVTTPVGSFDPIRLQFSWWRC
jgi:hypothetical protein